MLLNGLPDSCSGCPLSTNPHCGYFTKVEGKGHSGVMIIGEASGELEGKKGLPFRPEAPAGSILEKAIKLGGGKRDDYWITNIIRCRPPNNILAGAPYESEAISHCSQYLHRVISELKPRAILSLGSSKGPSCSWRKTSLGRLAGIAANRSPTFFGKGDFTRPGTKRGAAEQISRIFAENR